MLKDHQRALQTDGYAAYSIYEEKQGVLPLGCMAHVRRKFENAIRPIALGRKNYLFSGNDSGVEDNCTFYTLIGSSLQASIEPYQWLASTLEKIPTMQNPVNWDALLP